MRFSNPVVALGAALSLCGCGAFDFEMEQFVEEVHIPGDRHASLVGEKVPVDIIPPQHWDEDVGGEPAGVFVEGMSLMITDTARAGEDPPDSFAFIEALVFYVQPTTAGSTLPRQPLAWLTSPGHVDVVALDVNRALNLAEYIAEGFQIDSEMAGTVPPTDVTFVGVARLMVDVF